MELGTHPLLLFSLVTLISVLEPLMGRILSHRYALSCGPRRIGPALRKMLSVATQSSKLVVLSPLFPCTLQSQVGTLTKIEALSLSWICILTLTNFVSILWNTYLLRFCLLILKREKLHYPVTWNCEHERKKARHKAECSAFGDCPVNGRHGFKCMLCLACPLKGGLNTLLK